MRSCDCPFELYLVLLSAEIYRLIQTCFCVEYIYLKMYTHRPRRSQNGYSVLNRDFLLLRTCIPNVSEDTKLSKIQILRLAVAYIAYLNDILQKDSEDFYPFTPNWMKIKPKPKRGIWKG